VSQPDRESDRRYGCRVSDPPTIDSSERLAERQSSATGQKKPWRLAPDIAREIAAAGPYLTGLADELRACLTDTADDLPS
jgi:hypothetical protein